MRVRLAAVPSVYARYAAGNNGRRTNSIPIPSKSRRAKCRPDSIGHGRSEDIGSGCSRSSGRRACHSRPTGNSNPAGCERSTAPLIQSPTRRGLGLCASTRFAAPTFAPTFGDATCSNHERRTTIGASVHERSQCLNATECFNRWSTQWYVGQRDDHG